MKRIRETIENIYGKDGVTIVARRVWGSVEITKEEMGQYPSSVLVPTLPDMQRVAIHAVVHEKELPNRLEYCVYDQGSELPVPHIVQVVNKE